MVTGKKAKSTGPKSAAGKAKSSQNAVSHGLTSNRVMPDEIRMVEEFTQELTHYYKPESPLEVLQIQRIAFCRAKLAKLIDMEVAGREIARRQIDLQPELVVQKLTQYSEKLRSLALASIKGESVLSSLSLDETTLNAIAHEIKGFVGTLEGESDLSANFPKLCAYLSGIQPVVDQINDMGVDQALMIFGERIRNLAINQKPEAPEKVQKGPRETKFDEMMYRMQRTMQIDQMATRKTLRIKMPGVAGYHNAVEPDLQQITELASVLGEVPMVVQSFQEMKSWMMRAADLQSEETDRMMKYQTMLERRLSSAIGELLELRKYRLN
jgi:hypothetical protein